MAVSEGLGIVNKILAHFTPKERNRKIKDKIDKLEREKSEIIVTKATKKKANRVGYIDNELARLNILLKNSV